MGAGWLYYHKYPPKRRCPHCGKRHSLKRLGSMSNRADVWKLLCPQMGASSKMVTSDGYEGWL